MTTVPVLLTRLAGRFDDIAATSTGRQQHRAQRNAKQLRTICHQAIHGLIPIADAMVWADAAAGQLIHDRKQLDTKAGSR